MELTFQIVLYFTIIGLSFAAPNARHFRWCTISDLEQKKCNDLMGSCNVPDISLLCMQKSSTDNCMAAIRDGEADAIFLDSGEVYKASKDPHNLKPIIAATDRSHQVAELTKCTKERQKALESKLIGAFIPQCDEKGNYQPQQCHGSTGYCWCVTACGEKIEGTNTKPGDTPPKCAQHVAELTKCMKERQKALESKLIGAFIPRCDEKGNYQPQQCHGSTGYCWCVTACGEKIEGTNTPPGETPPKCAQHALCLANPVNNIRWCVKSEAELKKCRDVSNTCVNDHVALSCVLKASSDDCFKAISDDLADAISLDSGEIYKASCNPYNLRPVAAENYGTEKDPDTCYYSVALVKESSNFLFMDLKGKRTCHTAVWSAAGWTSPVGTLIAKGMIDWKGPESQPVEKAVAEFVSASCAPGAKEPKLCKQCKGKQDKKCKASEIEPYYGYSGACLCLKEDSGDVAFVKHILPDECKKGYALLCLDNTRKPVEEYEKCFWGRIPAHAVVTADKNDKIKAVVQFLEEAQKKKECKLFGSPHGKDLMFKNSATSLITLPEKMDAFLYLGPTFTNANKALFNELEPPSEDVIRWCTQNVEEKNKCDSWSIASEGKIECVEASSAEECITKVLKGEADAVALDGGYMHTAGACGLVPAMQEIYDAEACKQKKITKKGTYYAVAVVKKSNKDITWKKLRGTNSCHTGLGRTAGYNIPAGLIHKEYRICDLATFFSKSCIPGADVNSNLCKLCAGDDKTKCLPNTREPYFSYQGALRCLVAGGGDVAFVKHTTAIENTESENAPAWAKGWTKDDFELLCLDGTRKPVTEAESCHLAEVPAHGVATTAARKDAVIRNLNLQQQLFGENTNPDPRFRMFASVGKKDQLFKDSTKCLREVEETTMNEYLGKEYSEAIQNLNECGKTGLLAACTFHTCKLQ